MKGDCTEYAQLFVALARLNGIPAREVGGLVYNYSDKLPQFSGHAWAEVWMGDGWREVDPGWNEFNIDATHLRLSDSYFTDLGSLNERIELVSYE
jgi:transglutaminase-like putative cysteine protease